MRKREGELRSVPARECGVWQAVRSVAQQQAGRRVAQGVSPSLQVATLPPSLPTTSSATQEREGRREGGPRVANLSPLTLSYRCQEPGGREGKEGGRVDTAGRTEWGVSEGRVEVWRGKVCMFQR